MTQQEKFWLERSEVQKLCLWRTRQSCWRAKWPRWRKARVVKIC